tara:strand:- start:5943 stop:6281 length:339 start_codon:yes stop_codon:yes gene_type:complete
MASKFAKMKMISNLDINGLKKAEKSYGDSWKKRGGVGAFMMLARKWDRIENQVVKEGYDIFETISKDPSTSGILDDIQDLRRYLLLVEEHVVKNPEWLGPFVDTNNNDEEKI